MHQVKVNGTYPLDGPHWAILGDVTEEEAAEYLGVPRPEDDRWYLFLNKGYVVVDPHETGGEPNEIALGLMEMFTEGEVGKSWPQGTWAIYVHDGRYYIIERRRLCPTCGCRLSVERDSGTYHCSLYDKGLLRGCGQNYKLSNGTLKAY